MRINKPWKGASAINNYLKNEYELTKLWELRWKPVCASTEIELNKWLLDKPLLENQPRAIIAERQTKGKGQFGRHWDSLRGGVWLSAAFPFSKIPPTMELFGLAAAFALVEKLEIYGVKVQIKWPNDLIVCERKIAGFLPRLVYRGSHLQFARLGIGFNVQNRSPVGAISLKEVLNIRSSDTTKWTAEIILSIDRIKTLLNESDYLCNEVQKRLFKKEIIDNNGKTWDIRGVTSSGKLQLVRGNRKKLMSRW